jgi:site-specific recombinase XerD
MDAYAAWLFEQQYTHRSSRYELRMAAHACKFLRSRGIRRVEDVSESDLQACYQLFRRKFPKEAGSIRVLMRFLMEQAVVQPSPAPEPSSKEILVNAFMDHLRDDRGYAFSTVRRQGRIISEFLDLLKYEGTHNRLASLNVTDFDDFIQHMAKRMGRVALQKVTSTLRNFLRFLTTDGVIPLGLESRIDAPRVYRQEQLPRALPWSTVQAFLDSIDRNTAMGKRDYAMFSLMATYGLRACDVVALKLDDIHWRAKRIQVYQTKTSSPLELPLTDEVSSALYDYLKGVARYGNCRQIFLRLKAPGGILKPTAVIEAFQAWSRKSALDIPYKGTHWLRHSYALHLCRQGLPLKTIGDLLGHRTPDSTAVYILGYGDLRAAHSQ